RLGTRGGAAILRRDDIGSIEPGKQADLAVWRTDGLALAGAADPVAGLVLAGPHRVERLYVGGEEVVREGRLVRADEEEIARAQLGGRDEERLELLPGPGVRGLHDRRVAGEVEPLDRLHPPGVDEEAADELQLRRRAAGLLEQLAPRRLLRALARLAAAAREL